MKNSASRLRAPLATVALSVLTLVSACASAPAQPVNAAQPVSAQRPAPYAYVADIEVVPGTDAAAATVSGIVFDDVSRDGRHQPGEPGVPGVLVSNGRDVVRTGTDGRYSLSVREDMSVSVVQPAGWRTPTAPDGVPRFAYEHKPAGSPKPLRYGGLPPTGPVPERINFPLAPAPQADSGHCLVIGDSQTYSNNEVGYFRDSVVHSVLKRGSQPDCAIFVGDVLGDDLNLMPRLRAVGAPMGAVHHYVHGNHDYDFDADRDADSADSWRRLYGPNYYAFTKANTLFVALDNVVYPCGVEDARLPGREFCANPERKAYNGRIPETQMQWLTNLLALTPRETQIVILTHIPLVSFVDQGSTQHQTDNLRELHALLAGRPALAFAGHTHTLEVMETGDHFEGWTQAVGIGPLPFPHIIAGAASGGWWGGDFDTDGVPLSLGRLGEPRGYLEFRFGAGGNRIDFVPLGTPEGRRMGVSVSTPGFRSALQAMLTWRDSPAEGRDPVPPVSINDIPDVRVLTPEDLSGGAVLMANVWQGATSTQVSVSLNGGPAQAMTRTQAARGEPARIGVDFADPYAALRQLSVGRTALQSRSGNPAAQGYVGGRRAAAGPQPPQPAGPLTDRSVHLWTLKLPADLPMGVYTAEILARGPAFEAREVMVFEIVPQRLRPDWDATTWNAFQNGPPLP